MATPVRSQPIALPIPTGGLNFVDPLASMPPNDSPWMVNLDCENQSIKVRPGYQVHCDVGTGTILALGTYGNINDPTNYKIYAYVDETSGNHKIYDVTTSTASLVDTLSDNDATKVQAVNIFGRLAFTVDADSADCGRTFDGTTWSSWGFTYDPGGGAVPISGKVVTTFKSRVYIFNGTNLYYGALSAISGATTNVDYTTVFSGKAEIAWAGTLSSPGDRPEELYFAFGNFDGEVLVYAGDYPNDPNWRLIGRFKTSSPVNYNSIVPYSNDVYITTTTGVVSLRALFSSSAQSDIYVSYKINPYFTRYFSENFLFIFNGGAVHIPDLNKIFFLARLFFDRDTETYSPNDYTSDSGTFFVFNTNSGAWSVHNPVEMGALTAMEPATYYNRSMYIPVSDKVWKLDTTVYKDASASYYYEMESAWNNFGSINANKRLLGVEAVLKTDFDGSNVTYKAASDFGRKVSSAASLSLLDGHNIPYYSVGAEGTYIQYRMEGTSDTLSTDGLELYSVGAIIQPGGVR